MRLGALVAGGCLLLWGVALTIFTSHAIGCVERRQLLGADKGNDGPLPAPKAPLDSPHCPPPDRCPGFFDGIDAWPSEIAPPENASGAGAQQFPPLLTRDPGFSDDEASFMSLAGSIRRLLALEVSELPAPEDEFWDSRSSWAYLLNLPEGCSVGDWLRLGPEEDLRSLWQSKTNQALWRVHQEIFLRRQKLLALQQAEEFPIVQLAIERMDEALAEIRVAILGASHEPAYRFLLDLGTAVR